MTDLAARARKDAEQAHAARAEYERTRPPDQGQRLIAHEVGRILGIEVDPRTARDDGWFDARRAEREAARVTPAA